METYQSSTWILYGEEHTFTIKKCMEITPHYLIFALWVPFCKANKSQPRILRRPEGQRIKSSLLLWWAAYQSSKTLMVFASTNCGNVQVWGMQSRRPRRRRAAVRCELRTGQKSIRLSAAHRLARKLLSGSKSECSNKWIMSHKIAQIKMKIDRNFDKEREKP